MSDPNQHYHDRVAARYDDIYAKDSYWSYYFEITWRDLKKSLPTDLKAPILDVGCGTGLYGLRLLKSGFRVVFSDLSPKMLDVARARVEAEYPGREAGFERADITDLAPFSDESFSFVVGQGDPLSFSSDFRRALRNIRRVLLPKGRAVLSVDNRYGGAETFLTHRDLTGLDRFLNTGDHHWLADDPSERFPLHAFTPEELHREVLRAGLRPIRIIGKTVFDLRHDHPWLNSDTDRRRLLEMEESLGETAYGLARAHHLQITCERPAEGEALDEARTGHRPSEKHRPFFRKKRRR